MSIKDNTLSLSSILDTVNNLPTAKSDVDLKPENIKKDVEILGVTGTYEGVELNFEVVGGTTQPINPTENMIWVNTNIPISRYYFSSTEPENMIEGEVWIRIGVNSNVAFEIVDDVTVYPLSAKQYVNGIWEDVTVKSWYNNAWVDWIVELYFKGKEFTEYTGGWERYSDFVEGSAGTVEKKTTSIKISRNNVGSGFTYCGTQNPIDLTNVKTITVNVTLLQRTDARPECTAGIFVTDSKTQDVSVANKEFDSTGLVSLDVSGIVGKYYVAIRSFTMSGYSSIVEFDRVFFDELM